MKNANIFFYEKESSEMKIKRLTALVLGFCLTAALAPPAFATPAPCGCGEVLQVFVRGFLRPLYYDYEAAAPQKEAFLLLHLLMDDQGKSKLDIGKRWQSGLDHDHLDDPEFEFLYDYRIDAFEQAAQLKDFIEHLCEETGHDKIAISGMSQGTSVVMTYIAQYGTDRLETLILCNGAYQGAALLGELLTNRLALSAPATITFIESLIGSPSPVVSALFDLWRRLPLAGLETPASGDAFWGLLNPAYDWAIARLLGQMPAVWTLVPREYRADALKLLKGGKYDYLRGRADKFYDEVQDKVPELLEQAVEDGVKVAVIAAYGKAPIPLTKNASYQTDMIMDTYNASGGATVAPVGEFLDPVGRDPGYLSPDHLIDASTCNLPDKTWFVKYNGHTYEAYGALRDWIIHYDGVPTIGENADFPQFLRLTEDGLGTEPLDERPVARAANLSEAFKNLIASFGA
jgi:pimeloyl-ACP methyl ester carboxylesterase